MFVERVFKTVIKFQVYTKCMFTSFLHFHFSTAFGSCVNIYPELSEAVLASEWLPRLVKEVADTTGNTSADEILLIHFVAVRNPGDICVF